ncbi:RluA family pseudouridine synthase [Treponema sp.]|uniref:RluA family pseudouridine synthase n=1 Tax=Treponema sp. TaxID=166 RepID=UPI00388E0025
MFAPFDENLAFEACRKIISFLDENKIALEYTGRISQERADNGIMIGACLAKNALGKVVLLYTVSGNARKIVDEKNLTGGTFVAPIVSIDAINDALYLNDDEIHKLTDEINSETDICRRNELKQQREKLTTESLSKVHDLYTFHCFDRKIKSLKEICAVTNKGKLPPTGTGDCCAPKLLDHCYKNGLMPLSMCEVYYGKDSETKKSGHVYSPCDERCGLILPEMLGLRILYRDDDIVVVDKQSGLLSVPGRGPEKEDSVETRFRRIYGDDVEIKQPAVHRLDMETSGIMVLAFTKDAHRAMNMAFERGDVQKEYVALLDGVLVLKGVPQHGQNELYFRLDVDNRPHQIWDDVNGKKAITEWNILGVEKYIAPDGCRRDVTRIQYIPHTGRTHQLRLVSADSHGFGMPIIGDTLYGHCEPGERLMLHAKKITFPHPTTGEKVTFECKEPF